MVEDKNTNLVYFSDLLRTDIKYSSTCKSITTKLDQFKIKYKFLENTNDIWARDYMPIQVTENEFIEYLYDPDYLQNDQYFHTRTITSNVCQSINLTTFKTDIIIDGGNIIKSSDCLIMTDKIYIENKENYHSEELTEKLKSTFGVNKIVIIPKDGGDIFGHADGMIRFIDEKTVILNGYFDQYGLQFRKKLFGSLEQAELSWKFLKFNLKNPNKNNWAYINFLQMKELLLIPKLNIEEDQMAIEQFYEFFPDYASQNLIQQVDVREIIKDGGALNCVSWNILIT